MVSYAPLLGFGIGTVCLLVCMSVCKVDLEVLAMKGFSTLPNSIELETYLQIEFNVIAKTPLLGVRATSTGYIVSVF